MELTFNFTNLFSFGFVGVKDLAFVWLPEIVVIVAAGELTEVLTDVDDGLWFAGTVARLVEDLLAFPVGCGNDGCETFEVFFGLFVILVLVDIGG